MRDSGSRDSSSNLLRATSFLRNQVSGIFFADKYGMIMVVWFQPNDLAYREWGLLQDPAYLFHHALRVPGDIDTPCLNHDESRTFGLKEDGIFHGYTRLVGVGYVLDEHINCLDEWGI